MWRDSKKRLAFHENLRFIPWEANPQNITFRNFLLWPIHLSTQLMKPEYLVIPPLPPDTAPVSLETLPFIKKLLSLQKR